MSTRPRFRDLTDFQRSQLLNGCGRKGGFVPVSDFIWKEVCDRHDFRYWIGGGVVRRLIADVLFLISMVKCAWKSSSSWAECGTYLKLAFWYFMAVRSFGWIAFHWGSPRTIDDLPQPTERPRVQT